MANVLLSLFVVIVAAVVVFKVGPFAFAVWFGLVWLGWIGLD